MAHLIVGLVLLYISPISRPYVEKVFVFLSYGFLMFVVGAVLFLTFVGR